MAAGQSKQQSIWIVDDDPDLQLGALGGGGLFKTVQAPFTPGSQTWAVLLVHPKGLVSATKRVRVVTDKAQLNP